MTVVKRIDLIGCRIPADGVVLELQGKERDPTLVRTSGR